MNNSEMHPLQKLLTEAGCGGCYDNHEQTEPSTYCDGFIKAETLKNAKLEYDALDAVAKAAAALYDPRLALGEYYTHKTLLQARLAELAAIRSNA